MMKILFICTHNRCRSILAEAVTNHISGKSLLAKSAGSQPVADVHPLTLKYLSEAGIAVEGLCSQSWDDHKAWEPDVVITVCDKAAGESCPLWFGDALKVHWGLEDPSSIKGSDEEIASAFKQTIFILESRIKKLLQISSEKMNRDALENILISIERVK